MPILWDDLRYSLRLFRKSPSFTVIAILALALGIGANTAIFSVVNGVLLQPLPYPEPNRLVMVYEKTHEFTQGSLAYPNFLDWRRENHSFTDIAAYRYDDIILTGAGQPEHLDGERVTASLFPVLGVSPALGRSFSAGEDRLGASGVVMVSYGFWQRRFGGSPDILGKPITLNARTHTVIGVLPREFRFRDLCDVYLPLGQWDPVELNDRQNHPGLHGLARLKSGVSMAAAQSEMDNTARQLSKQYPITNADRGVALVSMKEDTVANGRRTLLLMLGAVTFVLIIACANVANLLLAQSHARRREFAIRVALGASRRRVIRQLLTESIFLATGAGALGLLLAYWGTRLVLSAFPDAVPGTQAVGIDPYVLFFTVAVSVLTGVLFGLAPAFHGSNANPQESLKEGARGSGGGRHRAEGVFVALEVGLAVVLLAGAGLMSQSIWRLWRVDPGFQTQHLLTGEIALSPSVALAAGTSQNVAVTPDQANAIRVAFQQMLDRVEHVPGVRAASLTSLIPLSNNDSEIGVWLGRRAQPPADQLTSVLFYIPTPDYLRTMNIPLIRGRFFDERDTVSSTTVIVIDEVMAKHLFPGQDPIGQQLNMLVIGPAQIIGVVGHVKHWGLDSDDTSNIRDEMYFPFYQVPDKFMPEILVGANLLVRTQGNPYSALAAVRSQVAGPTNDQPVYHVRSMEQIISEKLEERKFTMLLLIIFSATALVLASVGIYGVMSYSVTRRTHEMGVRMALGATRGNVLKLVVREGMALALAGMVVGVVAALGLMRVLASLLYEVKPTDPVTLALVSLSLGLVASVATYLPARRATQVEPMTALRYE